MTGAITLKEGAANGLKFPNDVFGGSGDTAGMRLIARSGEAMSLEVYLTNDADDWFNISVPNDSAAKVNGNTIWHVGNLTNFTRTVAGLVPNPGGSTTTRYLREDGTWVIPPDTDTVYVHPTTAGNKHIPSGGSAGQILRWSADGTAAWGADNDTTYSNLWLYRNAQKVEPFRDDIGSPSQTQAKAAGKTYYSEFNPLIGENIINFWSDEGDIILDPFAGRTRCYVAGLKHRKYIGFEITPSAFNSTMKVLEEGKDKFDEGYFPILYNDDTKSVEAVKVVNGDDVVISTLLNKRSTELMLLK
jgi:hypothetical protein